jgi:hypothetical protein
VVYQKSNRVPAKVRTFVDFLTDRLGRDAALKPVVKVIDCYNPSSDNPGLSVRIGGTSPIAAGWL